MRAGEPKGVGPSLASADRMRSRPIRDLMTKAPITIGGAQTLARAHELMRAHRVRHLPVLDDGRLVGMVSQRDLYFIETLKDVDPKTVLVEEAMTREPYAVTPRVAISTVARTMVQERFGAAVVIDAGRVVGIFTALDALKALSTPIGRERSAPRAVTRSKSGPVARA